MVLKTFQRIIKGITPITPDGQSFKLTNVCQYVWFFNRHDRSSRNPVPSINLPPTTKKVSVEVSLHHIIHNTSGYKHRSNNEAKTSNFGFGRTVRQSERHQIWATALRPCLRISGQICIFGILGARLAPKSPTLSHIKPNHLITYQTIMCT
jgi:hypothetical protein